MYICSKYSWSACSGCSGNSGEPWSLPSWNLESSGGDKLIIVTYCRNRDKYLGGVSLSEGSASVAAVLLPVRDTKLLHCPLSLVAYEQGSNLNFSQTLKSYLLN